MNGEKIPLTGSSIDHSYYSGKETNTGEPGTTGISGRILHGLTIISVLTAFACTIYGTFKLKSAFLALPFIVVFVWVITHILILMFMSKDHHNFQPPPWFIFVSSAHIFIESLIVIILTLGH